MKSDVDLGRWILATGTLRIRNGWRWVPVWFGPVYARRWWQFRGVVVGVFGWSYYVSVLRQR